MRSSQARPSTTWSARPRPRSRSSTWTRGRRPTPQDAIQARADVRPDITLDEGNAVGKLVGSIFDFVINAVNGLLAMSVIVALVGIVNTLSLSILERRRELGLLRVVGMLDKRVQRMVRLESVVIAALGTLSGVVLGLFMAWALIFSIDRLARGRHLLQLPLAAAARSSSCSGSSSACWRRWSPARRSTRLDVLDAIQAT